MRNLTVTKSKRPGKKNQAKFEHGGPTVHFGAAGMSDYTKKQGSRTKEGLHSKTQKNENWKDKESAGFWSRFLLWEKPSLREAAKSLRSKRLDVSISM